MHYDDESRRATSSRRPGTFAGLSPEKFVLASSTNDSSNNNNNNVNFINKIKNFSFWPPQSKKRRRNKYNNNSSIIDNSDDSKVDELHQRERESSLSENNGKKTYRHYELFITKLENSQIFENKRNFFRLLEDIRAENNGHDDYQQKKRAPQIWSQKIDTGLVNHLSKKFIGTSDAAFPTNELKREILADNDETLFYLRFKREKSEPKDSRVSEEDRKFRNNRLSWATSYSLDTGRDLGQAPDTLHHNTNNLALIGGAPTCVWRLAKKFESGDMDQVGPLKLYQTQVYKRELEKICVHNQGDVHQKACMFEDGRSRSKESETPEDDQSTSTRRQESFMRAVLHMDPKHHRISVTDKDLRELDRRTKRRISYIKATNVTPSSSAAAQSTKTLGRKKMSSSVFVADPGDESSNLESFDYDKNTRQENKRIMPRSISNDQPINRKSLDWSKNDDIAKQVHRLSTISSSSCLYDSFSSITATAGIDASTSTTATLTPASTTSWSSDRVKNRYDLHYQQHLGRAPDEPFCSPSPSNFLDRRNLEDVGEKVEEKFMSNNYPSHQQAPLSAGLIRQMPGVQKIFNFFTGGETSQQQNLSTLNKEEEKILDSEIGGGRRRRLCCNPSPSTSRAVFSTSDAENTTAGGATDNNKILKANSTLNISASTAGSTSCLSAASSSGGGNAGSSPGGSGGRFHSQPRQPPTPQQALRQKRNICLPCAGLLRDGPLTHKRVTTASASTNQGRPRRFNEKVWRHYWSVLHNSKIYLCKQKPSLDTNDSMIVMSDVCDENVIDIEGCIADIAYDYHKRKNVFRLTTQNQNEHLFQAEEPDSMLQWLKAVQCCSSSDDNLNNSMALIVKRYEAAQSHSVSPSSSSRLRRPAFMNINVGGTAAPLTSSSKKSSYGDGNENLQPRHGKVKESVSDSSGQSQTMTATAATTSTAAMKNNVHAVVAQRESSSLQSVLSAHAEKFDRKEKGEISISVKSRKWRKVRKSGSCPSGPNARSGGGTNSRDCMLGQQIEECVTSGDNDYIPLIVRLCVKVVEHYGLNTIGVYRIPGNTAAVNALISSLDKGFENTDFNDSRWRDVNVVSSLLKAFLRRLPDPLLTDRFYLEFIQANRIDDNSARLRKLKQTIHKLPRANYETTKYLMFHLRRIVQHSEINKMEAKNLALMFAPSIIRPGSDSMATMVSHMSDQCKIIESLILYCDWLFSAPETSPGDRTPPLTPILIDSMEKHDLYSPPEMSELLSRMVKTEEDLMHAKHSITKNILKIRRNSRKSSTKIGGVGKVSTSNRKNDDDDDAEEDEDDEEEENERQDSETENEQEEEQQQESFNSLENLTTTTPLTTLKKNSKNLQRRKSSKKRRQNDYNERNIDAEIENRRQENFDVTDFRSEAEELRRLREEQLYTARRIFITGPPLDAESLTPDVFSDRSPVNSGQVENLQALNINSLNSSLDVLSPETREKIRQFQAESRKFSSTLKVHNLPNNKPIGNKNCSSSTNLNIITTNMNCKQQAVFLTPESAVVPSGHSSHQNMMSHSTMLIPGSGNQPNTTSDYSSANDSPVSGYTLNNNNVSCRESERQLRATAAPSTKTPKQQQQTQDFALQYFNNLSISISTPAVVTGPTNYKMSSQNDEIRRQKNQSCESCTSFSISPSTTSHSREWSLSIGVPSSSALAEKRVIKEDEEMQQISQVFSPPKSSLSSKIGQKMKFRSRSASNLKRKETRRHTLSNARDVENMVQKALEKNRAATEDVDACVKKRSGGAKFRFWFGKE